jgi:hypothetical protein
MAGSRSNYNIWYLSLRETQFWGLRRKLFFSTKKKTVLRIFLCNLTLVLIPTYYSAAQLIIDRPENCQERIDL